MPRRACHGHPIRAMATLPSPTPNLAYQVGDGVTVEAGATLKGEAIGQHDGSESADD